MDQPPFRVTQTMRSRKLAALDFVKRYFARWGRSPSLGEIAAHLDVSTQRAHELVQQLSDEQMISVVAGKARGIRLPDRAEEIGIADALLRLQQAGFTVIDHSQSVLCGLPPLTEPGLTLPADLDYLPPVDPGVEHGSADAGGSTGHARDHRARGTPRGGRAARSAGDVQGGAEAA